MIHTADTARQREVPVKNSTLFRRSIWWKYVVGLFIAVIYLLPIYVLINMSLKSFTDLGSRIIPPSQVYWGNFNEVFKSGKFLPALFNTAKITLGTILIEVVLGCAAAYPLARNSSKINSLVYSFIMGTMMIPALAILVGVYTELVAFNGINQTWSVIAITTAFGLPLSICLFTNFIHSIPVALDEAAAIDGAGVIKTFWIVILPQLKPVTVSVIILKGVGAWNDYLYPYYILQKPKTYTLVLLIKQYFGSADSSSNLHGAAAAAVLCVLPLLVLYILLQKYFVHGQLDSSVK